MDAVDTEYTFNAENFKAFLRFDPIIHCLCPFDCDKEGQTGVGFERNPLLTGHGRRDPMQRMERPRERDWRFVAVLQRDIDQPSPPRRAAAPARQASAVSA